VLTAEEDNNRGTCDPSLLNRATELRRLFFTNDKDFLQEGTRRQREGILFYGVVYADQWSYVGMCIEDLETMANVYGLEDIINSLTYLPL